jgi:hypothetical protein
MKIAILISGRIHKYKEHYENIKQMIIQHHEVDFFLSHSPELNENIEEFIEIYQPKCINNDELLFSKDYSKIQLHPLTNIHNFMSMVYNRNRVFHLMEKYVFENNIPMYDLILSFRIECLSLHMLDFETILQTNAKDNETNDDININDNTVFVPNGYDWGGLNDQLAFGNYKTMKIYMNLYNDIWTLMKEQPNFGPETILLGHLIKNNVNISRFPFSYHLLNGKYMF